ncbi:fibronectin type III domain-containing protein [Paenibacillus sp. BC26]|uniref:fibronectin type III domain-containing protein n=1 Tax=Paenibacillus sp. BC26 TaxID=1881032 RepID=UPI0008F1BBBF|nr:fibronectin type III domain-containing protein [Paenibacillus sp. BC26]SFT14195.1 Chitodextrinase [Paenibacillus sp. BC26]
MRSKNGKIGTLKVRVITILSALSLMLPIIPATSAFAATLNVTAYGANGGDTADDLAAIQNAVNAAASGDTVLLPAGTYYLSANVNGKSGVKIAGAGRDVTTVRMTSGSASTMFFYLHNVTNAEVADMTLDGNNSTVLLSAVTSESGDSNKMRNLRVKDLAASAGFGPFALYAIGSTNLVISNNIVTNTGVNSDWGGGVRAGWGSSHALIENNTIADTGRGGIFVNDDSPYATVRGNTITGTGKKMEGLGIELHTNVDYSVIENNNVDHWISAVRSKYIAVRNNIVKANDGSVGHMGLEVMVDHGVTSGNLVDGGQQVGMQQSPGTGYQLWNYNTVQNIIMWGMQLQGAGTGFTEQYQYFYKNIWKNGPTGNPAAAYPGYDGNAVRIHGDTKNIVFDSNQILNNGRKAIEITTAGGTDRISFINNTITGNGGPSIDQYPSSAADLEWSNNTVSGNGTNTQLTSRGFSDAKPVANFTAPLTVQLGQPITFTNTSTDNGTIVENLWDLGEGIPVTTASPTYTYQKAGTYKVILGVWDNGGRASVKEQTVTVFTGPPDTTAPTAPGSLSAPTKSNVTVDLSWTASTDNVGVIGYDVYRGGTLIGSTTGASATTFTATGLTPSTAYSFTVKAKDASGNVSAASNTLNVTTDAGDTQAPTAPSSLTSPTKNDTSVSLSWSASSDNVGVTGYNIYNGSTLAGTTTGVSATSFTVTGLASNTAFTFTVKAKDASNNISAASNSLTVTTDPAANWVNCAGENNPCNFTGTKQVRYGVPGSYVYGTFTNTVMCSNNGFGTDPAVGQYKTCDVNQAGGTGGDTQAPTAPTGLTSPSKTSTSVSLSWTASTDNVGVTGYDVYNGSTLAGSTTGATTFTVSGLTASTAYTFTVKAKDAAGNASAASSGLNVTTNAASDTTAPSAPTGLSSPSKTSTSVSLSWTASTDNVGVTGYDIYNGSTLAGSTTGATTFTVSGLTASTAYTFTVKAKDAAGNASAASSGLNVTTNASSDTTAPTAPTGLTSPSKTDTSVSLSWTASTDNVGVTGYNVYNGATLAGSTTGATTFTVTGLTGSTAYSFTVKAKDAANNLSAASSTLNVTTNAPSSGTNGLLGQYYAGEFGTLALSRTDATIDFDWGGGRPTDDVPGEWFTARWTGKVQPQYSETYTFYTNTDDGVRLWVNGTQIINNWVAMNGELSATITLTAGVKYDIKMEYIENGGNAHAQLSWSSASQAKQIIPTGRLFTS